MNIFEKLFTKLKPKTKSKNTQSWYNDYQQTKNCRDFNPENLDNGAKNSCELNCTKSIARR